MRTRFTKMHGAGNDFVVLDETRGLLGLQAAHYRFLADRHRGVGADQILSVRAATRPDADFQYVIHNADGGEVEHCGNGARCFVRYVHEHGLSARDALRVQIAQGGLLVLRERADGNVEVDMGAPRFEHAQIPFDPTGLQATPQGDFECWSLDLAHGRQARVAVLSMGNPHAVQLVDDVDAAPVLDDGPLIEHHPAFARRVNAGFMQIVSRSVVALRVYERGAGETLACGTGACAAVVAGIRLGLLDPQVEVHARGGTLHIGWQGAGTPVRMAGPATTVFEGEIDIPEFL